MRRKLNLDIATIEELWKNRMILVHGDYASGKTHLGGDFLATERERGPVVFWNMAGEDGYLTLASFGLGETGETLENVKDVREARDELIKTPVHALYIDGVKALAEMNIVEEVGEDRPPQIGAGDDKKNEWSDVHWGFTRLIRSIRACADIVLMTVNSDKNTILTAGTIGGPRGKESLRIGPDLPGKQGRDIGPWDFVGYLEGKALTPGRIRRTLSFVPDGATIVRQRLANPITMPLVIPEGRGGWAMVRGVMERALMVNTSEGGK